MSGETEAQPSGWTPDLLKQHFDALLRARDLRFDQRFTAQQEAIHAALLAAKEAVSKAESATERRFDAVNEFRAQLADQASTFARQDNLSQALEGRDKLITALTERVRELELARSGMTGGQARVMDQRAVIAGWVGAATLIIAVIVIVANVLSSRG